MSQFTVCRSWNGYCLLLDDDRIAGGKPDYHEGNVFYEWRTRDTYGPVDELQADNDKLRELLVGAFEDMNAWQKVIACSNEWGYGKGCLDRLCELRDAMQELGMKVVVG